MRIIVNFIKVLRSRIQSRRGNDGNVSDKSGDDKVTRAMAKKIVDDARKHRLAINEDPQNSP